MRVGYSSLWSTPVTGPLGSNRNYLRFCRWEALFVTVYRNIHSSRSHSRCQPERVCGKVTEEVVSVMARIYLVCSLVCLGYVGPICSIDPRSMFLLTAVCHVTVTVDFLRCLSICWFRISNPTPLPVGGAKDAQATYFDTLIFIISVHCLQIGVTCLCHIDALCRLVDSLYASFSKFYIISFGLPVHEGLLLSTSLGCTIGQADTYRSLYFTYLAIQAV